MVGLATWVGWDSLHVDRTPYSIPGPPTHWYTACKLTSVPPDAPPGETLFPNNSQSEEAMVWLCSIQVNMVPDLQAHQLCLVEFPQLCCAI